MGITCLKVKKFRFRDVELIYYVGISQIKFDGNNFLQTKKNEEDALNFLFNMIEELQSKNKDMTIQFVKDDYILNENHIYLACYYMEKAFLQNTAISHKKNIELLLYLSTYRQISKSINAFGVDLHNLKEGKMTICISSRFNITDNVLNEILQMLDAIEIKLTINATNIEKLNRIIENYKIYEGQIKSVLKSYGIQYLKSEKSKYNLEHLSLAIFDIICEKMALLSLE